MRKWVVAIACLLAFYMDAVLFRLIGIGTFAPEALIALFVCLGVLMDGAAAQVTAVLVGLLMDILFNKIVGPSGLFYLGAVLAGSIFRNKYYADNLIIPSVTAAGIVFVKEHIMLIIVLLTGGRIASYVMIVLTHILPSALLTGGFTALAHLVLKSVIYSPLRRKDIDNR